jgi:pimeloyl-ACP methyl ester carboxylesterase
MATCWFILLPFAEHRLTRQRWFSDYSLLFASAWRNTIKLLSATVFTGLFWLLLLLWAQESKVLSAATVLEMRRRKPDLELLSLPGLEHAPWLGLPAAVARIDDFIGRLG